MSRKGQRGFRRSNFTRARNRLNTFNRDALVRNWAPPTGLLPFRDPLDPHWGGLGPQYNATGNTSTTTPSLPLPSVDDGYLNILFINVASGTNLTDPGVPTMNGTSIAAQGSTNADGWLTVVTAYDDGSPGTRLTVIAKVFATGDSTTFQWGWTVASNYAGGSGFIQAGSFDPAAPIPSADIQSQVTASTSYPTPSITTSVRGVIFSIAGCRTNGTWTPDQGDTLRLTEMRSSTANIAFSDAVAPVGPGTYSRTWTNTASTAQANLGIFLVASNPGVTSTTVTPTEAAGTGAALDATVATGTLAPATEGAATGAAFDATIKITPGPVEATATGTANDATVKVTPAPTEAAATGVANDADPFSTSIISNGANGNNSSPTITLSSSITAGQRVLVMLMLNNTDNITASPSVLTTLDSQAQTGAGQGTSYLYEITADSSTAGSVLTWTLAATRAWGIAYIAVSNVDQDPANPYDDIGISSSTVTATTSHTMPTATPVAQTVVFEFFGAKANGTALSNLTAPSGWSRKSQTISTNTFGSNVGVAINNALPASPATYGGDAWTTDLAVTTTFKYVIALDIAPGTSAAITSTDVFDASPSVTVYPAEAATTASVAWDAGDTTDTLLIGDTPIFVIGTAYDATVSTAVATTVTPTEAAATGTANDATATVAPAPTEGAATGAAQQPVAMITPPATEAAATGTALDATAIVAPLPAEAAATGAALDAATLITPIGTEATATGAGLNGVAQVTTATTQAAATGTANDAAAMVTALPTEAAATGAAFDATTTSSGTALPAEAAATGAAFDATVSTSGNTVATPTEGAATGAAFDAVISTIQTGLPTEAAATGTALDAVAALTAAPVESAATGSAVDATASLAVPGGLPAGTGAANDGAGQVTPVGTEATATAAAFDATVGTSGAVLPTEAAATGQAFDATTTSTGTAFPTEAPATGTANDATTTSSGTAFPTEAPAIGDALQPSIVGSGQAVPTEAPAIGSALDPGWSVTVVPAEAAATGAANDPGWSVTTPTAEGASTGTAADATANVAPAPAEAATGGAAFNATILITFSATEAAAVVDTASSALVVPTVTTATGVLAAFDTTVRLDAQPTYAEALATAGDVFFNNQRLHGRSHVHGRTGTVEADGDGGRSRSDGPGGRSSPSGGRGRARLTGGGGRT